MGEKTRRITTTEDRTMKPLTMTTAFTLAAVLFASFANATGYLWFGSEMAGEGSIYRYNIRTKTIDLVASPTLPAGATHWNNMATDGTRLYLGNPGTQYVGFANILTGQVDSSTTYSSTVSGIKEDGAYRASSGTLWRVTFSDLLVETTTQGVVLRRFVFPAATPGLVGLEWVGETLYATNYSTGNIGTIALLSDSTASFTTIPWALGGTPPGGSPGDWTCGLAYDQQHNQLYMATYSSTRLFTVTFPFGQADARLVVTLEDVGYVTGGLIDGMGWVAGDMTDVPNSDGAMLFDLEARPNPSSGAVDLRFRVPQEGAAGTLAIWDLAGRTVRTLADGRFTSGAQSIRWDGRDESGARVAAGVYLYRLELDNQRAEGKVTLVR
jgi:hypothetical protein